MPHIFSPRTRIAGYRPDIDGLRAVAIISVLLYHLEVPWLPGGFVGVDVFFVISGYLITKIIVSEKTRTGTFDFGNFYIRRVRRLFPALFATLTVSFVAAYNLLPPDHMRQFGGSLASAVVSLSNFFFWSQSSYFDTGSTFKPLLHTWSLSVEEQFYAIWPILLLLSMTKLGGNKARLLVVVVAAGSLALNLAYQISGDAREAMFFLLPFRAFELAIGGLLVWLAAPTSRRVIEVAVLSGFVLILAASVLYDDTTVFPTYNALVPCVGAALVIWAGSTSIVARLIANPVGIGIGLISYSLYLVHWPLIVFFKFWSGVGLSVGTQIILGMASVALAAAMYFLIEIPGQYARLPAWITRPRFGAAWLALALCLVAPGARAFTDMGWRWRYDPEILELTDPKNSKIGLQEYPQGCFLSESANWPQLDERCYRTDPNSPRMNIILVGDSSAAALYPGLRRELADDVNLYLWSASACPPVLDFYHPFRPHCQEINETFFRKILPANRYDLVILSAARGVPVMQVKFPATADWLNELGTRFVLIGRPIVYDDALPSLVFRYGKIEGLDEYVRAHVTDPCDDEDGYDKLVAPSQFLSAKQRFCPDGILKWREGIHLLQIDQFHLSQTGSLYMAQQIVVRLQLPSR